MDVAVSLTEEVEPPRPHPLMLVRAGGAIGHRSWPGPPESRPRPVKVLLTDSPGVDLAAGGAASLRIHGSLAPGCASVGWLVVPSMLRGLRSRRTGSRPKKTEVEAEAEARARQGASSMA